MKGMCESCCQTKELICCLSYDNITHNFCSMGCVGHYAVDLVGCIHDQYCLCFSGIYT